MVSHRSLKPRDIASLVVWLLLVWLSTVYFSSLFSHGVAYLLLVFVHRMFNPFAECLYVSLLSIYCLYMYVSLRYLICSPILEDNK